METTMEHFGQWGFVLIWSILGSIFIAFVPFYKKSQRKPASVYIAFMVAMAFEMFGIPMSMYIISWLVGTKIPEGVFWGHTLVEQFGHLGMYIGTVLAIIGIILVVLGWKEVYRRYWSKEEGKGELITDGIYRFIRHPQYTGFMLITLGMLLDWATLSMLIMWPILGILYYRLARREERELQQQFGESYRQYMQQSSMFVPMPKLVKRPA
ncbi:MAG: isoprenylcysteine carboxylmethyltransferase family protein [Chloroflexi bacterium HGW-Chloroflexi-10]|nr:MAG: isoprenylcysteine carboxylmethyltransferase family protein [Chloroflexi bacterium HGW-Chloroflexi-10]